MTASLEIDVSVNCPGWRDSLPEAEDLGQRVASAAFSAAAGESVSAAAEGQPGTGRRRLRPRSQS